MPATYTTGQVAELLGVSEWNLYQSVRQGNPPIPPIRVGRRLVWPRTAVHRLLGLEPTHETTATGEPNPRSAVNVSVVNHAADSKKEEDRRVSG